MTAKTGPRPVIFGEVLFDRFPDGSVVLGGAPFNVAWHLQAFRQSPLFVSRVGNDNLGRTIRNAMESWGLSTAGLQMDSEHPTGTVDVSIDQGEPSFDIAAERSYDYIRADFFPPFEPSLLYHGTLALRNSASARALATLKERCHAPIFIDVNLRPPWWDAQLVKQALDKANWVKLNEHELEMLTTGTRGLEAKARALLQQHSIERLIITRGNKGAAAFTTEGSSTEIRPARNTPVVDTVGAGDAFASVTMLGLLLDWPLEQLMQRAQEFASALVGVRGATVQDTQFYQPFIKRWELAGQ